MSDSKRTIPARGDVAFKEATRDPIFLFQEKRYHYSEELEPNGWRCIAGLIIGPDDREVSISEQEVAGIAFPYWSTERVFFTREEGMSWGNAHSYNYRHGWRVFCVCAEGDLAEILRTRSQSTTGYIE